MGSRKTKPESNILVHFILDLGTIILMSVIDIFVHLYSHAKPWEQIDRW